MGLRVARSPTWRERLPPIVSALRSRGQARGAVRAGDSRHSGDPSPGTKVPSAGYSSCHGDSSPWRRLDLEEIENTISPSPFIQPRSAEKAEPIGRQEPPIPRRERHRCSALATDDPWSPDRIRSGPQTTATASISALDPTTINEHIHSPGRCIISIDSNRCLDKDEFKVGHQPQHRTEVHTHWGPPLDTRATLPATLLLALRAVSLPRLALRAVSLPLRTRARSRPLEPSDSVAPDQRLLSLESATPLLHQAPSISPPPHPSSKGALHG